MMIYTVSQKTSPTF